MGSATMWNIDVVVVALLAVIMLLLLVILGVILLSPVRSRFRKKGKKHASHIYETIDNEEDEQHNCVTQVLKIQVSSEREYIQQEMLLKVQVEAIPLQSGEGIASTSNFGPQSSPKPMLMHLQDVPQDRIQIKIKNHGNANFEFSQIDLEGRKPSPPPKTPSVKMPVTPSMIKDPSLLSLRSRTSESEHVALVHSQSMEETSGYLQPSSLRRTRNKGTSNKEQLSERQY